eukprot:gene9148-12339_t
MVQGLLDSEYTAAVLFVVFGIGLGTILESLLKKIKLPIPYTVLVFYSGIILAVVKGALKVGGTTLISSNGFSADLIVYGFLPALLFSETMNLNWHHVKQCFYQSTILAGPGAIIVAVLIAVFAKYCLPYDWPWLYCFLFGAILSATDPVSVVDLLKRTKASSKLSTIIAGESLLNDGSAMILYFFVSNLLDEYEYTAGSFIAFCSKMILLSPLIGAVFGFITFRIMKRIYKPTSHEIDMHICLTFLCGYSSFYFAQSYIQVSGVLSCCSAGVTLAFFLTPRLLNHEKMHAVWSNVEWVCNTLIFLLAGLVGGTSAANQIYPVNILFVIVMFFILLITRFVMMGALYPLVSTIGLKCTFNEAIFISFSGLRGALAIALVLNSANDASIRGDGNIGEEMFFLTTALVSLTLLLNGSTAGTVLLSLGLIDDPNAKISPQKQQVLDRIKKFLRRLVREELREINNELGDCDMNEVARLCQLLNKDGGFIGNKHEEEDEQETKFDPYMSVRISNSMEIDHDLIVYIRTTFLEIVRARYEESIETGKIGTSATSAKLLLFSIDVAMDDVHRRLNDWDPIVRNLKPNKVLLSVLKTIDDICHPFGIYPGLVSRLDTATERIAIYTLINYIDAHEYALNKIHYFLGGSAAAEEDISFPEENNVRMETDISLSKARYLLNAINREDVKKVYTLRAARVIILKQTEIIERMIADGALSEKNAHFLLRTIETDSRRIFKERESYDRNFIQETQKRKIDEERVKRDSFRAQQINLELGTETSSNPPSRKNSTNSLRKSLLASEVDNDVTAFRTISSVFSFPRVNSSQALNNNGTMSRVNSSQSLQSLSQQNSAIPSSILTSVDSNPISEMDQKANAGTSP